VVPAPANPSAGQSVSLPVQFSATSQVPATARQVMLVAWELAVQTAVAPTVPEQIS
jgi:hypothetical protein